MRLTGRDERGFAVGSYQARQAERLYRFDAERTKVKPTPIRKRNPSRLVAMLEPPPWVAGFETATSQKRSSDRKRARRAALELGVDPPEWTIPTHEKPTLRIPDEEKLRRALEPRDNPSPKIKQRARAIAKEFGVEIPAWAAYAPPRTKLSEDHREKIREGIRRRASMIFRDDPSDE